MIDGARSAIIIKAFNLCLSPASQKSVQWLLQTPCHVLGLTDESRRVVISRL